MNLSEKIRNARTAKGMSQKELAKAAGISERTIQNYEIGARMPKKRDTYTKLAKALDIREDVLLDDDAAFVLQAAEQYGSRGHQQAQEVIRHFSVAMAGGEMDDDDLDFIKDAMMTAYYSAKAYNQRFKNKRYDKKNES